MRRYGGILWSDEEIALLRQLYPTALTSELRAAFPGRTSNAVRDKANALGVRRPGAPKQPARHAMSGKWEARA